MKDVSQQTRFDLVGIGNAITDVLGRVEEDFLRHEGMTAGSMALIGHDRAAYLYDCLSRQEEGAPKKSSGGSVANSCVVASYFGAKVAYLGKVANDELGRGFQADIEAAGVHFPSKPVSTSGKDDSTACCFIFVTPDGQRTMNTYLGICTQFGPEDVIESVVRESRMVYLEGYLFDQPRSQEAFYHAAKIAHEAGRQVALSLSDPFCVERSRADFLKLIGSGVDVLFANEAEICALYETTDFEHAASRAAAMVPLAVLTRGAQGSVILKGDERIEIPAVRTKVKDTTGAGDAYAAGFLAGFLAGDALEDCGRQASMAAAEIISHFGSRPLTDIRTGLVS